MGAASRGETLPTGQRDPRRGEGGVGDGTTCGAGEQAAVAAAAHGCNESPVDVNLWWIRSDVACGQPILISIRQSRCISIVPRRAGVTATTKQNGLLRGNPRRRLNTAINTEFFNLGNTAIITEWREYNTVSFDIILWSWTVPFKAQASEKIGRVIKISKLDFTCSWSITKVGPNAHCGGFIHIK
jgi:hypothetical protein